MDKSDTPRNLLLAMAIFFTVLWIGPRLLPVPSPTPPSTGETVTGAQPVPQTAPVAAGAPAVTSMETPHRPADSPPDSSAYTLVEADTAQTFAMGSAEANGVDAHYAESPFRMRLTVSNIGASVESATMTDHAEAPGEAARYQLLAPVVAGDGTQYRSLAIEKIRVDETDLLLHDKKWHSDGVRPCKTASGEEAECLEFWIEAQWEGEPLVKIVRSYTLPTLTVDSGREDLYAETRVESLADRDVKVLLTYRGGVGVKRSPSARMLDEYVDWGISADGRVVGHREQFANVAKKAATGRRLYPEPGEPGALLSWAATANTYFTCTLAPLNADGSDNAKYLAAVDAVDLDGSSDTTDDATVRFVAGGMDVKQGASLRFPVAIYLGQKNGDAFRTDPEYSRRNYYYQISQGFGICTFTFLVELMIWLLNSLFFVVRDFGVAIVILVMVVRFLLHPITKKGQVNMVRMQHRMQELAPKIEEVKKKYANDKARMNQEMMKLNINPAGQLFTCLPMMIQMPIWIALYLSLSNNILMRHEACVFLPWIHDLTAPDALYVFSAPIVVPLFGWVLPSFNLLPIFVAVFMYTQQKLQPKPTPNPNATEQQRQQQEMMQKMMPMMSIMMLIIFYKMPAGLNLYIMCSSLFGTIEQKRIRQHIKEREAAGTLHKKDPPDGLAAKPKKPGRLAMYVERLQKAAEEAKKMPTQRPGKRPRR